MGFCEYVRWRFLLWIQKRRDCHVCRGSDGHCYECNEYHHLFQKDWRKAYLKKMDRKKHRW